jgi:hypothetical protein
MQLTRGQREAKALRGASTGAGKLRICRGDGSVETLDAATRHQTPRNTPPDRAILLHRHSSDVSAWASWEPAAMKLGPPTLRSAWIPAGIGQLS